MSFQSFLVDQRKKNGIKNPGGHVKINGISGRVKFDCIFIEKIDFFGKNMTGTPSEASNMTVILLNSALHNHLLLLQGNKKAAGSRLSVT